MLQGIDGRRKEKNSSLTFRQTVSTQKKYRNEDCYEIYKGFAV